MDILISRIEVIDTSEKLEELYQLRYKVFVEEEKYMYMQPNLDRKLYDQYDMLPTTINLGAFVEGNLVGGARLTPLFPEGELTADLFNFKDYIPDSSARCGTGRFLCVLKAYRRWDLISVLMSTHCYWAISLGFTHICTVGLAVHESFFRKFGFKPLSNALKYKNTNAIPMVLDLQELKEPYLSLVHHHIEQYGLNSRQPLTVDLSFIRRSRSKKELR